MPEETNPTLDAILRKRRRRTILRVGGVGAVLAIGGVLYWRTGGSEPDASQPTPQTPTAAIAPAPAPEVAPAAMPPADPVDPQPSAEARPIPPLRESDGFVRESAAGLSSRPEWTTWIATDELIRRFVAAVDAVGQGESPAEQAPPSMRPARRFEIASSGALEVASAASFARYDGLTAVLTSLDTRGLVAARGELAPLLEEAHRDLGHGDRTFEAALRDAIFALLSTPSIVGQPPLERLTLGYGYVDPELEQLSAAKKQLLRFGPENVLRLQEKIREVAIALGIPAAELPPTPRYAVPAVP